MGHSLPAVRTLLLAILMLATVAAGPHARAGDRRQEYEVDFDAYHQLNEQFRLYLAASVTDVESQGSNKGQGAAYLDITLKGVVRERLHMADWARERKVWVRVGYAQYRLWDADIEDVSERRGVLQLTIRSGSWEHFQLTHRFGLDYRSLEGNVSQRYRYRLNLEYLGKIDETPVIPYVRGEVYYDSRYSDWSKQTYQTGFEINLSPRWRVEPYFALDIDTRPSKTYTDRIGVAVRFYW